MNSQQKLVMMANQIAANLMHEPDPTAATTQHILLYWDPRMKEMIASHDGTGLSHTAAAAISGLKAAI